MTTTTTAPVTCTARHDNILHGFVGTDNAPGSFGAFIADIPVGAELLSVSGWICRWTGEYVDANGHRAARLERIRHTDGRTGDGDARIHTCLMNAWSQTGRYSFRDGAVVDVRHERGTITPRCSVHGILGGPLSFRDRTAREMIHEIAADHARTHPPIDVRGWRRWPSDRLEAALDIIDDSTALWDKMSDELAQRDHEHQTRINNGGVLP